MQNSVPALQLSDVSKAFGQTKIIRKVNLAIGRGERHAIIGPNGAGKSTLLHLISGRLTPDSGSVRLNGESITGQSPDKICRAGISRSFQITNLFHRMSVFENLRCAALCMTGYRFIWWQKIKNMHAINERAEQVLKQIGLSKSRERLAGELAYAEQRALEIGLAIIGNPAVILLDEPTAGMSRPETHRVVELIREVTAPPRSLVMIEHDMSVVFSIAETISVLVYGEIIASGPPSAIQSDRVVQQAYLGSKEIVDAVHP